MPNTSVHDPTSAIYWSNFYLNDFFFSCIANHPDLHSFPTRRSSDLQSKALSPKGSCLRWVAHGSRVDGDRKSTRLNSSHSQISYAVFCLKKKTWRWPRSSSPSGAARHLPAAWGGPAHEFGEDLLAFF